MSYNPRKSCFTFSYFIMRINNLFGNKSCIEGQLYNDIILYSFLFFFGLTVFVSLNYSLISELRYIGNLQSILKQRIILLNALTIVFGLVAFWCAKDQLKNPAEKEKAKKESEVESSEACLVGKVPKLKRMPFIRAIFRWIEKEGWGYLVALTAIIVGGCIFQLSLIGDYYYWTDEVFSLHAAKMIIEKGMPVYDSGLNYGRAPIYHHLLAGSMLIFGIDEFGSRVINVIFNSFTALTIYLVINSKSKYFALLGSLLFMTSSFTVAMTIETRFYAMFSFIYLFAALSVYFALFDYRKMINMISLSHIKVDFNYKWLFMFFISLYLAYKTHDFFFVLIFGLFLYSFYELIGPKPECKYYFLLVMMLLLILAGSYYLTGTFNLQQAYFEARTLNWARGSSLNPMYYCNVLKVNISAFYAVVIVSMVSLIYRANRENNYLFVIAFSALIFISYQRALQERYLFFLIPIIIIVYTITLHDLSRIFNRSRLSNCLFAFIVAIILINQAVINVEAIDKNNVASNLSWHKKLDYYDVISYIEQTVTDEIILADWHSAHTLTTYGIDVDYIIISKEKSPHLLNSGKLVNGVISDQYFNIPFIVIEEDSITNLQSSRLVIILRDNTLVTPLKYLKRIDISNIPAVYRLN